MKPTLTLDLLGLGEENEKKSPETLTLDHGWGRRTYQCGPYLAAVITANVREWPLLAAILPARGAGHTGAVARPLDGGAVSLAGNALAGEGIRGAIIGGYSLDLACAGWRKEGEGKNISV